jgi:tellurium resistance protein TerZ
MPTVSLVKGQKINLRKDNGSSLTKFCAGANWGALPDGTSVDLDLYVASFDSAKNTIEVIGWGESWSSSNGSIMHSGDDTRGDDGGDDGMDNEIVTIDLNRLHSSAEKLVVFLTSFRGQDFAIVPHASVRIYEGSAEHVSNVVARYDIGKDPSFAGNVVMVLGMFYKYNGEWKFNAIGMPTKDRTYKAAVETIKTKIL